MVSSLFLPIAPPPAADPFKCNKVESQPQACRHLNFNSAYYLRAPNIRQTGANFFRSGIVCLTAGFRKGTRAEKG
ncbi:hypothetical protein MKW98_024597 [Papaver atlanticum]|uniref:Uncharacterized protein n=1 Tax=Papaver atlanticum TaxID=357466 RepID=A0AAD4S2X9_9MAGN|nr:hypothetical protein MKW98_024597 [Papaver atlanticum]